MHVRAITEGWGALARIRGVIEGIDGISIKEQRAASLSLFDEQRSEKIEIDASALNPLVDAAERTLHSRREGDFNG